MGGGWDADLDPGAGGGDPPEPPGPWDGPPEVGPTPGDPDPPEGGDPLDPPPVRVVRVYAWRTAGDDRVCPACGPLDGTRWEDDDGPMPPAHAGCRCARVLVAEERTTGGIAWGRGGVGPGWR